jgi:hypothetical protein
VQQHQEVSLLRYQLLLHCFPALLPLCQQLLQLVRRLLLPLQQQSLLGMPAQCLTAACLAMQLAIALVCARLQLAHRCLMHCCRFASSLLLLLLLHLATAASQLHRLILLLGCCCRTQKSLLRCQHTPLGTLLATGPPAGQLRCLLLLLQAHAPSLSQLLHHLQKCLQLLPLPLHPAPFAAARRWLPHQQYPHHQLQMQCQYADVCVVAGCAAPAA